MRSSSVDRSRTSSINGILLLITISAIRDDGSSLIAALVGGEQCRDTLLSSLKPDETVRVLFRLSSDDQQRLLALIPPENAAELLYEFPEKHAADLIDHLEADQAAHIVDELPSDEGADILGSLDRDNAEAILDEMDPEAAGDVRELIDYPADAAGGLMELEQFAYPRWIRARDFIRDLRDRRDDILPIARHYYGI